MQNQLNFQHSPDLYQRVISRIEKEKKLRKLKINITFSSLFSMFSIAALIFMSRLFYLQGTESGFFSFLSLAFSDIRVISQNFNDLMLSIIESLPLAMFVAILIFGALSAIALKLAAAEFKNLAKFNHFKNYA
jgi:hypothetical protein